MKFPLQYLNDQDGNIKAVQLPIEHWEKIVTKLHHYEQSLKLKSDLKEALDQVSKLRKQKNKKANLSDFLYEL